MNDKAFTLIELLGVIIVISILTLVIGISVTSVLKSSKSELSSIQVSNIERAAKAYFLKEGMNNIDLDLEAYSTCVEVQYLIDNNYIEASEITNPIDKEEIVGSVKITYNSKKYKYQYQEKECSVCSLVDGEPNTIGSKYQCKVKDGMEEGFENGYYFYVLSHEENGTTNLIMDRNICDNGTVATENNTCLVAWINQDDYEKAGGSSWDYGEDKTNFGPITAMNYLNKATNDWSNIENLNIMYNDEGRRFINFKIIEKARLPYRSEVYAIGCKDYQDFVCPIWMVDYLNDTIPSSIENTIDGIYGYWTFSSHAIDSYVAWYVAYYGGLDINIGVHRIDTVGIRPVINLKL